MLAIEIPGITVEALIGKGAHAAVYRVRRDGRSYALKVPKQLRSTDESTQQNFIREAAALALTRHESLPDIHEVGVIKGVPYLILEYVQGINLQSFLEPNGLSEAEVIRLATEIAGALIEFHDAGLLHRDIKPSNLMRANDATFKLLDYGLATGLSQGRDEEFAGTFAYAAPEQSGVLDQPVDNRADLYALGITLFQVATGRLPFISSDVGELLRLHATAPIPDIREHKVFSPGLAQIIKMLMSKDPSDRYQSADALLADLGRIEELNARHVGDDYHLGCLDRRFRTTRYQVASPRYVAELQEAWASLRSTKGGVLVVRGQAGQGRTTGVMGLLEPLPKLGLPILMSRETKHDESSYMALRDAIDSLILTQYRDGSPASQTLVSDFVDAVQSRNLGPILFSKALQDACGLEFQDSGLVDPDAISSAVTDLMVEFAKRQGTTVWYVDELQWADSDSQEALYELAGNCAGKNIILIVTLLRDEESFSVLEKLKQSAPALIQLSLQPLDGAETEALTRRILRERQLPDELVGLLENRSHGNAGAVAECIQSMIHQGVLIPSWHRWEIDRDKLTSMSLSGDLVEMALGRLSELSSDTKAVLIQAALLGERFSPELLGRLEFNTVFGVQRALADARRAKIVEPIGSGGDYTFIHQELVESLKAIGERPTLIEYHEGLIELAKSASDLHLGKAEAMVALHQVALTELGVVRDDAIADLMKAAKVALNENASDRGILFLEKCLTLPNLTQRGDVHRMLGEMYLRLHRLTDAENEFIAALELIDEPMSKARIWSLRSQLAGSRYQTAEAQVCLQKAYRELEIAPPSGSLAQILGSGVRWLWLLASSVVVKKREVQGEERGRFRLLGELLERSTTLAYYQFDNRVMTESALRNLVVSEYLGVSHESMRGYLGLSLNLAVKGMRKLSSWAMRRVEQFAQELATPNANARRDLLQALRSAFLGDIIESTKWLEILRPQQKHLDPWLLHAAHVVEMVHELYRGNVVQCRELVEENRRLLKRRGLSPETNPEYFNALDLFEMQAAYVMGDLAEYLQLVEKVRALYDQLTEADGYLKARVECAMAFCAAEGAEIEDIDVFIQAYLKRSKIPEKVPYFLRGFYISYAQIKSLRLDLLSAAGGDLSLVYDELDDALLLLRRASAGPIFEAYFSLILSHRTRLMGDFERSRMELRRAENLVDDIYIPTVSVGLMIERSRHSELKGRSDAVDLSLQQAMMLCLDNGWRNRVRYLKLRFPKSYHQNHGSSTIMTQVSSQTGTKEGRQIDAIVHIGAVASQTLDTVEQTRATLDELIHLMNAERAMLFSYDEKHRLQFEAGRDRNRRDLDNPSDYSRGVVEHTARLGSPIWFTGSSQGPISVSESIINYDLRSITAAPIMLNREIRGVLYLDNKTVRGVFNKLDAELLGLAAGVLGMARELTRTIQTELQNKELELEKEKLARSKELAEQASEMKSSFLANMSHEIRNPMNGVIGMVGLMRQTEMSDEQVDYVSSIESCASMLMTIINDVLDFSKIEAGKLDVHLESVQLRPILEDVMELMASKALEKDLDLTIRYRSNLPREVRADGDRLRQVITNLVGNAIKFTERGSVEILVTESSSERLKVSVNDSGIGIPEDRVQAIFEEYSQATTTTTKEYGGTGLGLSISRRLVEMMGGELSVTSKLGSGSSFSVELPATIVEKASPVVYPWSGRRILVASKTENTNSMLYDMLEELGCDPVEAYPNESISDLCERFNEAKAAGRPFSGVILDVSRASNPRKIAELTELASTALRIVLGDVRCMNERKVWEDGGWPHWLLRPVKYKRLLDLLGLLNQEHRLDLVDGKVRVSQPEKKEVLKVDTPGKTEAGVSGGAAANVLIVDDNIVNQKLSAKFLEKLGCTISVVDNGQKALDLVTENHFDIIFMDCQMPVMDGYEATRSIRSLGDSTRANIPVVAMTANAMEGDRDRCLAAGMSDYITKPFKLADFKSMLTTWLKAESDDTSEKGAKGTEALAAQTSVAEQAAMNVLIVDDNLVNQKLSAKFLQKLGCTVSVVDNGKKAVEHVEENLYDIIFMDCQMPVMDGYEATRSIRALQDVTRSSIPVVAMTANAMAGDREKCLAAGMNDYITKPFKLADFKGMLTTWVSEHDV